MGILMKCIYCLEDKRSNLFTRDHVLPESFGSFEKNFTLINTVCGVCNEFFGKGIETYLARDTFEGGTLRYETNVKNLSEFKSMGKKGQLKIKILKGKYKGAYVYTNDSNKDGGVLITPCPQIGFLKSCGDYEYYLLDKIPHKHNLNQSEYNLKDIRSIKVLACDPDDAKKILNEKGFVIENFRDIEIPNDFNDKFLCEVERDVDDTVFRAIAKIGFNYLAYWEGTDFVIQSSFDPIRKYIRCGKKPDIPLRGMQKGPFFSDEKYSSKKRLGHIIAINWESNERSLVARISLFNFMTYIIRLAKDDYGKYKHIKRGHFFNVKGRNILEMGLG
ncbi:MAG TPA: hypothetical protein DCE80_18240 [Ignavibacteriales bacterium]|nr:hypothetical protein [Ignavibacteriales bacterium]